MVPRISAIWTADPTAGPPRAAAAPQDMSRLETQDMPCLETQDMSGLETEDMPCLETQEMGHPDDTHLLVTPLTPNGYFHMFSNVWNHLGSIRDMFWGQGGDP